MKETTKQMWEMENLEGSEEREGTWNNTGEKQRK